MAITIDIRDQASAALKAVQTELTPARVNPAIGRAEVILFQKHFIGLGSNKKGWPSTGFWPGAARATNFQLVSDGVLVSVNKQGVRQRYQGGEIKPTGGKKFLTIPARQEAYGRRAGEFHNLHFARLGENGPCALVEAAATELSIGRRRKDGTRKITQGASVGGGVMFWLVKSVKQKPDPGVIPTSEEVGNTAIEQVRATADRAIRRGGGE